MNSIDYVTTHSPLTEESLDAMSNNSTHSIFKARRDSVGQNYYGEKVELKKLLGSTSLLHNKLTLYDGEKYFSIYYRSMILNWGKQKRAVMFVLCQKKSECGIENIILASKFFEGIEPQKMIQTYFSYGSGGKLEIVEDTQNMTPSLIQSSLTTIASCVVYKLNGTEIKAEIFIISAFSFTYAMKQIRKNKRIKRKIQHTAISVSKTT